MTPYMIGLVLSHAGLNDVQVLRIRTDLKTIAQSPYAAAGIYLLLPSVRHPGPAGVNATLRLLEPLSRMHVSWKLAEVIGEEDVGTVMHVLARRCDEVWCCPGLRQTVATNSTPCVIHHRSQGLGQLAHKFKMLHPKAEVEPEHRPSIDRPKKQKPLKGW